MRSIIHLDADAFFASVEQAADPRLRGKPVAVGGEKRGIIASASYEARQFGIYTPMPTVRARQLCPKLILLPGDFEKYERFSRWMFSYAYDFTPDVEIGSIDEGYFDLTGVRQSPVAVADTIRNAIRQALKITVSEGIGSNKLVSQIASKLNKPAAFFHVPAGTEIPFLHPLPARWLPGVGPKTAERLSAAGLASVRQVSMTPTDLLSLLVGSSAPQLKNFAHGVDERPVVPVSAPAKSYGQQHTFAQDQTDEEFIEATLRRMADELMSRVRADGKAIRTLTVKVRFNDLDEKQCNESLLEPTDLETDIYARLQPLLRRAWERRVSLRLVALRLSNVYDGFFRTELALTAGARQHEARRRLAVTIDELRRTQGRSAILRGHDLVLLARENAPTEAKETKPPCFKEATPPHCSDAAAEGAPHGGIGSEEVQNLRTHRRLLPHSALRTPHSALPFVPLAMRSYYSFLDSTLSPQAIVELAQRHELPAIALCDRGNLHGAVEFVQSARKAGIKPILGAELPWPGPPVRLYVENAQGYTNLCRILSGKAEGGRQKAKVDFERADLPSAFCLLPSAFSTAGLVAVSPDPQWAERFPGRFYLLVSSPDELRRDRDRCGPILVAPPVHYAAPADRWKYDIVQSIRTLTLLKQAHPEKDLTRALHFRSPRAMSEWFREQPAAVERSRELADRCAFELPFDQLQFPAFAPPDGSTPREFLRRLVMAGMRRRYPASQLSNLKFEISNLKSQIETELGIIAEVGYEEYFLAVWDSLQECRRRGIEWITRGSAADSLVCYCLGISDVCPVRFGLYFRRFLNKERMALHKLPDIDVDFPHDRKDDVIDLMFERYGAEHCAVVGGFSTFKARSAFAEVAKVLGVAERDVRRFTEHFPWSFPGTADGGRQKAEEDVEHPARTGFASALRARPECADLPLDEEPYRSALIMAEFLDGFPRYAKMHPCGVVLSRQPMHELTPTFRSQKGYPTTHFDMDAVEAIGLVKMDILAQGGLAVMRDAQALLAERGVKVDVQRLAVGPVTYRLAPAPTCHLHDRAEMPGQPTDEDEGRGRSAAEAIPHSALRTPHFDALPYHDPAVWEMIAGGNARAVHHIESPAMISLCRMCHVHDLDTLIAIVSVIRPGAANEDRKREFTRRYQGLSPITYPHPSLEPCLRDSFGLLIYEEQLLQICEAFAGLPAGRADVLRRALGKEKLDVVAEVAKEFVACARARERTEADIARVWDMVSGFLGYTFCKAHSTAYGVEAYQSAWLKRYFPAEFMAAVLSNGKGFYRPLVYVLECWRLGLGLLPPWVNEPGPGFAVKAEGGRQKAEPVPRIRVPVRDVKGLTDDTRERILAERARGEFTSLADFYRRVLPGSADMELLIRVGALDGFGQKRTTQFWESRWLHQAYAHGAEPGQGWLFPEEKAEGRGQKAEEESGAGESESDSAFCLLPSALDEPSRQQRLGWEYELLGFPASGHPLELHDRIAWETYCPVNRLGEFVGQEVVACGLVIEDRVHHQVTGEPMKFLTLADWTGMIETELFAQTYKSYGLATVRYPVLEVTARVEPFENGRGYTLRVLRAGKPRERPAQDA